MPLGVWNLEWLNSNSGRRFPLADDASALDQSESFRIPNDFIVEIDVPIHSGMDVFSGSFFIRRIGAFAAGYSVMVGYQSDTGPVDVASALIPRQGHTRNKVYALGGISPFDDTVGKIVIGDLGNIDEQPPGFFEFDFEDGRLEPDAIRPIIRGVSSITLVSGSQRSVPLYGDIELVAGANIQLIPILILDEDPIIQINAITGEGLIEECVCTGEAASGPPIKLIDGIAPTADGRFFVIGSACIEVKPIANGIQLVDICSQPCCSCLELETITRDLERLKSESAAVRAFVDGLRTSVDTMNLTVLGSTLRDRSCIS